MHGLLSLDVTEARRRLASVEPAQSFTAFLVATVGRTAAAHPEVHAYRNWRGRLILHLHVDVAVLVEVTTSEGSFPLAHLIRDADERDFDAISTEIRRLQADAAATSSGGLLARLNPIVARIPGAVAPFYRLTARSIRLRRMAGTEVLRQRSTTLSTCRRTTQRAGLPPVATNSVVL